MNPFQGNRVWNAGGDTGVDTRRAILVCTTVVVSDGLVGRGEEGQEGRCGWGPRLAEER